jgi:hypothetical protein
VSTVDPLGESMIVALTRTGGPLPEISDGAALDEGARIAATMEDVRSRLFPSQRDGDMGCLIGTVQELARSMAGR